MMGKHVRPTDRLSDNPLLIHVHTHALSLSLSLFLALSEPKLIKQRKASKLKSTNQRTSKTGYGNFGRSGIVPPFAAAYSCATAHSSHSGSGCVIGLTLHVLGSTFEMSFKVERHTV